MLPCDVQPMLAAQQGQQSGLPRLGPSFLRHGSSRSSKPAQRGLYGKSHGYGPSSSQPCPIPSSRTHAVALAEAPTSSSISTVEHTIDLGYDRDIERLYEWGRQLGKGGNGVVRIVTDRLSGTEYACKAIKKVLSEASDKKKAGHIDSIKREVEVLRRLSGSLNIIRLVDVFEDDENVYIVQECCKGGELCDRIGEKHYSERTVGGTLGSAWQPSSRSSAHGAQESVGGSGASAGSRAPPGGIRGSTQQWIRTEAHAALCKDTLCAASCSRCPEPVPGWF